MLHPALKWAKAICPGDSATGQIGTGIDKGPQGTGLAAVRGTASGLNSRVGSLGPVGGEEVALVGGSVWFRCGSSIPRIKFRAFLGESDGISRTWKITDTHRRLDVRLLSELCPCVPPRLTQTLQC